jgi:hypothetical protein
VGDRGVLAGGVDPLEHDEQRALLLGVQARLQVGDVVDEVLELRAGGVGVAVSAGVGGILVGERDRRVGSDAVERVVRRHGTRIPATMGAA